MESHDLVDFRFHGWLVAVQNEHLLRRLEPASRDAANADAPHVARIVEIADLQLQRSVRVALGRGNACEDGLEQGAHVCAGVRQLERCRSQQRRGIHHRKIKLVFGSPQLVHHVEGSVHHPVGPRAGTVDLVHYQYRFQAQGERLARDEARLRHRTFDRVHEEQHAVHHRQRTLDFAAEIGVAGRVDDIDVHALVVDGGVLGEDGDAALALEVVRVHDSLGDVLVSGERAGLVQQFVDERRFTVIDVGDDREVADGTGHSDEMRKKGRALYQFARCSSGSALRR